MNEPLPDTLPPEPPESPPSAEAIAPLTELPPPVAPEVDTPAMVDGVAVARLYGEPLFALPNDLYIPPDALEVFLKAFQGPLDLLRSEEHTSELQSH